VTPENPVLLKRQTPSSSLEATLTVLLVNCVPMGNVSVGIGCVFLEVLVTLTSVTGDGGGGSVVGPDMVQAESATANARVSGELRFGHV
jgi:hypothetical protein